jgi:hypothetical protein
MLSNNANAPQAAPLPASKAGGTAPSGAILDPRAPIEVASQGTGAGNDPVGMDNKPPGAFDTEPPA